MNQARPWPPYMLRIEAGKIAEHWDGAQGK
jgi:predicted SnoaL-like aldol condensation-catalyzing enzyme